MTAAASGLYLASYYLRGLAGAQLLGILFQSFGWFGCAAGAGAALALAALLAQGLPQDNFSPKEHMHAHA